MIADRDGTETILSVILPASNEAALIGDCLGSVLRSDWSLPNRAQVIVVANGCQDDTATRARSFTSQFADKGWTLKVIERQEGGKLPALNAGDAAAQGPIRLYLDADVTIDPLLLQQIVALLDRPAPGYASGALRIQAKGWVSRAYARIWRQVPFMRQGVPGCGVFAVNQAGRARWGVFPEIISDDTFVRLSFQPGERLKTKAGYDWPIAEGFKALAKVRRRQDAGVQEIEALYPDLLHNDDKSPFPAGEKLRLALRDPIGFAIYTAVALYSKLTRKQAKGWSRSR